jgi:hypothetical protein
MKALQFHVTIAVPDGFTPGNAADFSESIHSVIRRNLGQVFTPPWAIFACNVPDVTEITVTPEGL